MGCVSAEKEPITSPCTAASYTADLTDLAGYDRSGDDDDVSDLFSNLCLQENEATSPPLGVGKKQVVTL